MRVVYSLLFLLFSLPASVVAATTTADDSIESVARLANAGAMQLALDKVERLQPPKPDKERWPAWEALRLTLLARLNRHQELLARLEKIPADAPADLMRQARFLGAQAALVTGKPALARVYLLALLWNAGTSEETYRQARLLVIDSYLDEGNQREGYLAMLRYQQDFQGLPPERVVKYVGALAGGGMEKEAVAWLAYLDQNHPLRLQVQLKTGLLAADAASGQARAALKKMPTATAAAGYWTVLGQTAAMNGNFTAAIEAQEQSLNLQPLEDKNAASRKDALWKQYQAAARDVGNREHLLAGDDPAWLNLAASLPATKAPLARALLAYLTLNARPPEIRREAQSQLATALLKQKLGRTALLLFDDAEKFPAHSFTAEARYLLGETALQARQYQGASRFWKDLPAPKGESADGWQLKLVGVHYRAGQPADAGQALERLLAGKNKLAADIQRRSIELARHLLDDKEPVTEAAEHFLTSLLLARVLDPLQQREALLLLGRSGEIRGDFKLAADYFLQAATLIDAKAKDPVVQSARQQAVANLVKAGFKEDASAVLQK